MARLNEIQEGKVEWSRLGGTLLRRPVLLPSSPLRPCGAGRAAPPEEACASPVSAVVKSRLLAE